MNHTLCLLATTLMITTAQAQITDRTSAIGGFKVLNAQLRNDRRLAGGLFGLSDIHGYTCGSFETYGLSDGTATKKSFEDSARRGGWTLSTIDESEVRGFTTTLFRATRHSASVLGSWSIALANGKGTLALCQATKK